MNISGDQLNNVRHVVAMPYPGRSHINPMMNLCKLLASRRPDNLLITFVITEDWLGYIGADPKPANIRFATIPDVLPVERERVADFPRFYEATMTKMEDPFEQLLDRLEPPVTAIVGDVELRWPIEVGNRRNIPVAVLWTMSACFFTVLHHLTMFSHNRSAVDLLDGHEEHIIGLSSAHLQDLQTVLRKTDQRAMQLLLECISKVPKANYLLFTTFEELEPEPINSLKAMFPFPIYPIGPSIPYFELKQNHNLDHMNWLDSQPTQSVLYISFGSFLSMSSAQMDELLTALNASGIRYFWVARAEASRLGEKCGDSGLVVPWCDQLQVLSHSCIGGFLSHCGWNSTLEGVFASVPMLTFPLFLDQFPNSSQIVKGWRNGWKLEKKEMRSEVLRKEEIEEVVRRFMDVRSREGKEMRERAKEVRGLCLQAIAKGGSSDVNLDAFLRDISSKAIEFH